MTSVHFDAGDRVSRASVLVGTSSFTFGAWFRLNSYASNFTWGFGLADAPGSAPVLGVDCNETGAGTLDAFLYTGVFEALPILTGSDVDWVFVAYRHVGGTSEYEILSMREGGTSLTSAGVLDLEVEPAQLDTLLIGDDGFGSPVDCDVRAFFADQSALSNAAILEIAQDFDTYDGSALDVFLPLTSAATAGTNDGTAGAFTVTGTPADEADEPDNGGGGGVTATLATSFDLSVAGTVTESIPSTLAFDIAADVVPALTVAQAGASTLAISIGNEFSVAATSAVANPITGTIELNITDDFVAALAASETIPSAIALDIAANFTVTAAATEAIPSSIAFDIASSIIPAATAIETIPSALSFDLAGDITPALSVTQTGANTIAVSITDDFTVAAVATEAITGVIVASIDLGVSASVTESIQASAAVMIDDLFTISATVTHATNDVEAEINFDISGGFAVAAVASSAQAITGNLALDMSADFDVAIRAAAPQPYRSVRVVSFVPHVTPSSRFS